MLEGLNEMQSHVFMGKYIFCRSNLVLCVFRRPCLPTAPKGSIERNKIGKWKVSWQSNCHYIMNFVIVSSVGMKRVVCKMFETFFLFFS